MFDFMCSTCGHNSTINNLKIDQKLIGFGYPNPTFEDIHFKRECLKLAKNDIITSAVI
jgi:hypothetical protein